MRVITSLAGALALSNSVQANAQAEPTPPVAPVAQTKPMTTCEGLARDWRNVEIKLAQNDIEEIADNSAPRATMRAIRDNNELQLASMTLSLMRDNKCALPKRAPSKFTYMLPAMECRTEQLKGNLKASQCDASAWTPLTK